MSRPAELDDYLEEALDVLDRMLMASGLQLKSRPLHAARELVEELIVKVSEGGEEKEPGDFLEYAGDEWFKILYARTVAWYRGRYGGAMDRDDERAIAAAVPVVGTLFLMNVPVVTNRPETPGKTIWICFPNCVEEDEDVLDWIAGGPNVRGLRRPDGLKVRRLALEVANRIRSIHSVLATVKATSTRVGQFQSGIIPHLEHAGEQLADAPAQRLKHLNWDLQMACELSLKILHEQRSGSFPETHDLYRLYDELPRGPVPFERALLRNIPNWQLMAEWRYGGGPAVTSAQAFSRYRSTLKIVEGNVRAAQRDIRIDGGRILIAKAPFLHDDLDMFKPRSR